MPSDLAPKPRRAHGPSISWSPLLVLGGSVVASVLLISTCMAMIGPEAQLPAPAALSAAR
ncbi:hypothetical protein [Ideonella sp. YS5]|uniref:hypothetical protein n=1 Tax=Ideonella sp. YS5 TaxID=3453714 RepID=UPI003EEB85E4